MLTSINFKSARRLKSATSPLVFLSFFLPALFISCNEVTPEMIKPNSSGVAGDVIVICPKEVWEGNFGKIVTEKLEQIQYGLNQPEGIFTVRNIPEDGLTRSLRTHHSIIVLEIKQQYTEDRAGVIFIENSWAKNQAIFKVRAASIEGAMRVFYRESDNIIYQLQQNELARLSAYIRANSSPEEAMKVSQKHGINIVFPHYGVVTENRDNFVWIRMKQKRQGDDNEMHTVEQGIFIWHYPFTDEKTFNRDFQIITRDSVVEANVPGPSADSYMTTQMLPGYQPRVKEINFNGEYALEMYGLWRVEGDFMSGPFKSITFLDKKRNRVITVEGWVYAPKFNKREYLREVEAMIKSVQLVD